jgi:hypothetical protein
VAQIIIQIGEPERSHTRKKTRTQINGKCNDISIADGNKLQNITLEPLFIIYNKIIHLFIDRRLRSCTGF